MSRAIRRTNRSVFALVAAMTAATAASTTASAFEPIRKPEQREAARLRKAAHPGSAPVDCTHYPGGAPSAVNCSMQYNNGPVISNVVAVTVFWSYEGKTVDSNITAWAQPFIAALVDSPFLDLLNEYSTTSQGGNQTVTRGTSTPAYTITPTTATGATVTDADIVSELAAQVKAGKLPAVKNDANGNPNTVYILFFAPGITINGAGGTSCVDFCGYHSSGTSGSTTYTYAVIPDLTVVQTYSLPDGGSVTEPCGYGCAYQADTKPEVEWFNSTVSHEIAEAVTDPAISANNIAWYDQQNTDFACAGSESQNQPGGGEIGDVCVGFWDDEYGQGECEDTAKVPGTNIYVQQVWSNALDGCYAFNAATSPECPPGGCIDGGPGPVNPAGPTPDGEAAGPTREREAPTRARETRGAARMRPCRPARTAGKAPARTIRGRSPTRRCPSATTAARRRRRVLSKAARDPVTARRERAAAADARAPARAVVRLRRLVSVQRSSGSPLLHAEGRDGAPR